MENKRQSIKIGSFTLSKRKEEDGYEWLWIGFDDGEGGVFCEKELEKVLMKFYKRNF